MAGPLHFNVIFRGSSVLWQATFFDPNGNIVNPPSATINVNYPTAGTGRGTTLLTMTPGTPWTAEWDSRVARPGPGPQEIVYWSLATGGPVPITTKDGQFNMTANPANITAD